MKWQNKKINSAHPYKATEPVNVNLWRSQVPGGWLVLTSNSDAVTFIPDPQHSWDWNVTPNTWRGNI
jgi:hypothetical protein